MSDDEISNETNESNEISDNESEEEVEVKIKKFDPNSLSIQSAQVNVKIEPKEDNSTFALLKKLKSINRSLDQVENNLSYAIDRYNKNTKHINNANILNYNSQSSHFQQPQSQFNHNQSQDFNQVNRPIPQQFDNFNNPYKKITTYGNTASKYNNDINELYKFNGSQIQNQNQSQRSQVNSFNTNNNKTYEKYGYNSSSNNNTYFNKPSITSRTSLNHNQNNENQANRTTQKIYYRRANEMD